jgi:hypothetical protein
MFPYHFITYTLVEPASASHVSHWQVISDFVSPICMVTPRNINMKGILDLNLFNIEAFVKNKPWTYRTQSDVAQGVGVDVTRCRQSSRKCRKCVSLHPSCPSNKRPHQFAMYASSPNPNLPVRDFAPLVEERPCSLRHRRPSLTTRM